MNMDEQKLTYEQFKEDILQWKNTHREEYNRFSRLMTNGDERQYLAICKAIFRQLPSIRREWELSWNDDSTDGLAFHLERSRLEALFVNGLRIAEDHCRDTFSVPIDSTDGRDLGAHSRNCFLDCDGIFSRG